MSTAFPGGLAIRQKVLVVPTVSCVNRVVELVERARPDVAVLTHQHGCGMFDDDVDALSAMLAATVCHPHVGAAVLVSLGCESNQPQFTLARVDQAVPTAVVRFQDYEGQADVVDEVLRQLDSMTPRSVLWATDIRGLRIGISVEQDSALGRSDLPARLAAELVCGGAVVEGPTSYAPGVGRGIGKSLPEMAVTTSSKATVANDAQGVSTLVAIGCHLVVMMGDRPAPLGSSVAPVLTVGSDSGWTAIADVVVDVTHPNAAIQSLLSAIGDVVAGALTRGEHARVRTLSIRRISMTM